MKRHLLRKKLKIIRVPKATDGEVLPRRTPDGRIAGPNEPSHYGMLGRSEYGTA